MNFLNGDKLPSLVDILAALQTDMLGDPRCPPTLIAQNFLFGDLTTKWQGSGSRVVWVPVGARVGGGEEAVGGSTNRQIQDVGRRWPAVEAHLWGFSSVSSPQWQDHYQACEVLEQIFASALHRQLEGSFLLESEECGKPDNLQQGWLFVVRFSIDGVPLVLPAEQVVTPIVMIGSSPAP